MIFMVHLHLLSTTIALLANVTNIINFKASSNVKFTIGYGIQNPFIGENVDLSDTRCSAAYLAYANSVATNGKDFRKTPGRRSHQHPPTTPRRRASQQQPRRRQRMLAR